MLHKILVKLQDLALDHPAIFCCVMLTIIATTIYCGTTLGV